MEQSSQISMIIEIADIACSISGDPPIMAHALDKFRHFNSKKTPNYELQIFCENRRPHPLMAESSPTITMEGEKLRISRPGAFKIDLNQASRCGSIAFTDLCGQSSHDLSPRFLWNAIKTLYAYLLLSSKKGALMHSSAVSSNGHGHAFLGPSGAGKSTIASLLTRSAQTSIFNDDVNAITIEAEQLTLHSTPFCGGEPKIWEKRHAPLRGIYKLVQAPENKISPLGPAAATRLSLECIASPHECHRIALLAFHFTYELTKTGNWHTLHFAKCSTVSTILLGTTIAIESGQRLQPLNEV
jgi:hypothetical protein